MAPVPPMALPGMKALYDRALTAIQRCQETQSIDFKRSENWESLKWRIIETVLGMGNLRDGGIVIIGLDENDEKWVLSGISEEDLKSFDVDVVVDQINAYVSPHVNLTLVTLSEGGKIFLIIEVQEFDYTPLVCKKNGPQNSRLVAGAVYVRPPGLPRTTRVMQAEQMHELLELAAEKRARRMLEIGKRIGLVPAETDLQRFDEELEGL